MPAYFLRDIVIGAFLVGIGLLGYHALGRLDGRRPRAIDVVWLALFAGLVFCGPIIIARYLQPRHAIEVEQK